MFTYTFQRQVKISRKINITGDRVNWMKKNKSLVSISLLVSLLSSICFGYFFWENVWLLFLISGSLSFFYVCKVPGLNGKNLRDLPGIKIYIIGVVWVIITVLVPYLVDPNFDLNRTLILFVSEVLFMISIKAGGLTR